MYQNSSSSNLLLQYLGINQLVDQGTCDLARAVAFDRHAVGSPLRGKGSLHLGRGTFQPHLRGIRSRQVRKGDLRDLRLEGCDLSPDRRIPGFVALLGRGTQNREFCFDDFDAFLHLASCDHFVAFHLQVQDIGQAGCAQMLCNTRGRLSRISVDGLLAAEDDVKSAQFFDRLGQGYSWLRRCRNRQMRGR